MASLANTSDEGHARSRTRYALQCSTDQIIGSIPKPSQGSESWSPTPEDAYWNKAVGLSYSYPNPLARPVFSIQDECYVCTDHKVTVLREPMHICEKGASKVKAICVSTADQISVEYFITIQGVIVKPKEPVSNGGGTTNGPGFVGIRVAMPPDSKWKGVLPHPWTLALPATSEVSQGSLPVAPPDEWDEFTSEAVGTALRMRFPMRKLEIHDYYGSHSHINKVQAETNLILGQLLAVLQETEIPIDNLSRYITVIASRLNISDWQRACEDWAFHTQEYFFSLNRQILNLAECCCLTPLEADLPANVGPEYRATVGEYWLPVHTLSNHPKIGYELARLLLYADVNQDIDWTWSTVTGEATYLKYKSEKLTLDGYLELRKDRIQEATSLVTAKDDRWPDRRALSVAFAMEKEANSLYDDALGEYQYEYVALVAHSQHLAVPQLTANKALPSLARSINASVVKTASEHSIECAQLRLLGWKRVAANPLCTSFAIQGRPNTVDKLDLPQLRAFLESVVDHIQQDGYAEFGETLLKQHTRLIEFFEYGVVEDDFIFGGLLVGREVVTRLRAADAFASWISSDATSLKATVRTVLTKIREACAPVAGIGVRYVPNMSNGRKASRRRGSRRVNVVSTLVVPPSSLLPDPRLCFAIAAVHGSGAWTAALLAA